MKGKEIIESIVRVEMPDVQQVRNICLNRPNATTRKRMRPLKAAVILAACLLFSITAVLSANYVINRISTGGSTDIVVTPYGSSVHQEFLENPVPVDITVVHFNRSNPHMAEFISESTIEGDFITFDAERAQEIMELLANKIFTVDGTAFDLLIPAPLVFPDCPEGYIEICIGEYRADSRGNVLFNALGEEIGTIGLVTDRRTRELIRVDIRTVERFLMEFTSLQIISYEHAAEYLGRDFRIPAAQLENFEPPVFRLFPEEFPGRVIMAFTNTDFAPPYATNMIFHIENVISGGETPRVVIVPDGTITELKIANVTVYKIFVEREGTLWFTWVHDGLVYNFHPPREICPHNAYARTIANILTDEQLRDIIRSMIE